MTCSTDTASARECDFHNPRTRPELVMYEAMTQRLVESHAGVPLPDLLDLIERGDRGLRLVQLLMDRVGTELHRLEGLTVRTPLNRPRCNSRAARGGAAMRSVVYHRPNNVRIVVGIATRSVDQLIPIDVDAARLATARALGATHTINARETDAAAVMRLTDHEGVDVVIEASGAPSSPLVGARMEKRGGRIHLVEHQVEAQPLDLFDRTLYEITIGVAHARDTDLPEALAILSTRNITPDVVDRVIGVGSLVSDGLIPSPRARPKGKSCSIQGIGFIRKAAGWDRQMEASP